MTRFARGLAERLERGDTVDLRGDGKAGGGLVLAVQAFGQALARRGDLDVQDWPLFSSARKGANVRAFLRVARGEVQAVCQVTSPQIALLMNAAAGEEVDFAEGTRGGIYVVNSPGSPAEAARRYRLSGLVATIGGDDLGVTHLGRPLGNIAAFAALVRATELVPIDFARESLAATLEKRRLPARIAAANLALFDDALERVRMEEVDDPDAERRPRVFAGYPKVPVGAQAALRSSRRNRTSGYGRPGVKIEFNDATNRCNGCSLCVVQCPEGIIEFEADRARGTIVHGARFELSCKVCRECVTACPLDLFAEVAIVSRPDGAMEGA